MGSRATKGLSIFTPARYADLLCDRLRMYMRPVHQHQLRIPVNTPLATYQQNAQIWQAPHPQDQRTNPWHAHVDDIMFYL